MTTAELTDKQNMLSYYKRLSYRHVE